MMEIDSEWKMDKRIPIAVVLTLLIQAGGALIWATQLEARVGSIEQQSVPGSVVNEKFARLEERLDNMKQDMAAMRHQLDRLTDRLLKP